MANLEDKERVDRLQENLQIPLEITRLTTPSDMLDTMEALANAVLEEYRGRTTDYYIGAVTMLSVMALQIAVGTSKEILSATLIKLTEKCIERYNEAANTEEMLQRDEV